MYCVTTSGRIISVIYALIGIPLFLTILNDIGKFMAGWLKNGWGKAVNLWLRIKSQYFHFRYRKISKSKRPVEPTDEYYPFPVWLAIGLLLGWILICGAVFCLWEKNWSFGISVYFFFISLCCSNSNIVQSPKSREFRRNSKFRENSNISQRPKM